jgi:uncharacterized protein YjbI with pentapeptide repeats
MSHRTGTTVKKPRHGSVPPDEPRRDWVELLIIPLALAVLGLIWGVTQWAIDNKREDRRVAADRAATAEARQDTTLQTYLDQMSGLMLHERLLSSKLGDAVRSVAHTETVTTLHRLDDARKADVIQFLSDAGLVNQSNPVINLYEADASSVVLDEALLSSDDLSFLDLSDASLKRASLDGAVLKFATLTDADLEDASLTNAILQNATLTRADLKGANFMGANLLHANLDFADLEGAKNLDLKRYISQDLPRKDRKRFLQSEKDYLDSLSADELARFNLSPQELAMLREQASA